MKKITKILSLLLVAGFACLLSACKTTVAPTTEAPAPVTTTEEPAPVTTTEPAPVTTTPEPHTSHTWGDTYQHDADGHWKVCTVCGDLSAVEDHEMVDEVKTPATDTVEGVIIHTCSICGYSYEENTGLAFVWQVADGAYITDYQSKQADSHFTVSYSEDGKTAHIISSEDVGWSAIICYASGSTEGFGMEITVSSPEGGEGAPKAAFVFKPNDANVDWAYAVNANPGETKVLCYAQNDIPAEMQKMVILSNGGNRDGFLSIRWVKLSYTDSFAFNVGTGKIDQLKVCTTPGFEKYKTVVKSFTPEEVSIQEAAYAMANNVEAKTPVIISGKVSGVTDEDTKGAITITSTVDGVDYQMTATEIAKVGTLFTYSMDGEDVIASATSIANFKELNIKNGDIITVLGIIVSENNVLHAYGELLSIEADASQELPEGTVVTFTGFGTGSESVYPSTGVTLDEGNHSGSITIADVKATNWAQWCRVEFAALPQKTKIVSVVVTGSQALSLSAKLDGDGNPYDSKTGNKQTKQLNGNTYVIFTWDLEALGMDATKIKKVVFWAFSEDLAGQASSFRVEQVSYTEKQELPEGTVVSFTGFGTGSESVYPSTGVTLDEGNHSGSITVSDVKEGQFAQWCRVEFAALPANAKVVSLVVTGPKALGLSAKVDGDGNPYDSKTGNKQSKQLNGETFVIFTWDLEALGIDATKIKKVVMWAYSTDLAGQASSFRVEQVSYTLKEEAAPSSNVQFSGFNTGGASVYPSHTIADDHESGTITVAAIPATMSQWARFDFSALPAGTKTVTLVLTGTEGMNVGVKLDGNNNPYDGTTGNKQYKALTGETEVTITWDLEALGMDPTSIIKVVFFAYSSDLSGQAGVINVKSLTIE